MNVLPRTVSAKDIQRDYRRIFNRAKAGKEPVIVLTNNKPDVAIVGIRELETLYEKAQKIEVQLAMQAIEVYKKEKKSGKLKKLTSLKHIE